MVTGKTQCAAVRESDGHRCGLYVGHPGWPTTGHSYDNPSDPFNHSN